MLTHRDGWLARVKYRVPVPNIDELRAGSLNTDKLFDPVALTRATETAKSKKTGKVQDRLISKVSKMADNKEARSGKQTFGKQSFQKGLVSSRDDSQDQTRSNSANRIRVRIETTKGIRTTSRVK